MPSPILPSELPGDPPGEPFASGLVALPDLQLVPVPAGWPPYDCQVYGAECTAEQGRAGPGLLAAGEDAGREVGPAREVGPGREAGPGRKVGPAGADRARNVAPGASPVAAGQTTAWPRQFGQVIVEVLAGERASRQLTAWTTDSARAQVEALVRDLASVQRPRIQRIITSRPTARVVEMTMVVRFGPRSRALALRFEQAPARKAAPGLAARPARWLCTEIEAG
jgi:Family of unknown function (DUF6459)